MARAAGGINFTGKWPFQIITMVIIVFLVLLCIHGTKSRFDFEENQIDNAYTADNCPAANQLLNPCDLKPLELSFADVEEDLGSAACDDRRTPTPSETAKAPSVKYDGAKQDERYILIMVDPDAPSPENPKMRYWLHWVVADLTSINLLEGNLDGAEELLEYAGPTPPRDTGYHRYQLFLYVQSASAADIKKTVPNDKNRGKFQLDDFAKKNSLGCPVAGYQFKSKN